MSDTRGDGRPVPRYRPGFGPHGVIVEKPVKAPPAPRPKKVAKVAKAEKVKALKLKPAPVVVPPDIPWRPVIPKAPYGPRKPWRKREERFTVDCIEFGGIFDVSIHTGHSEAEIERRMHELGWLVEEEILYHEPFRKGGPVRKTRDIRFPRKLTRAERKLQVED